MTALRCCVCDYLGIERRADRIVSGSSGLGICNRCIASARGTMIENPKPGKPYITDQLCACGCGTKMISTSVEAGRKYIWGHKHAVSAGHVRPTAPTRMLQKPGGRSGPVTSINLDQVRLFLTASMQQCTADVDAFDKQLAELDQRASVLHSALETARLERLKFQNALAAIDGKQFSNIPPVRRDEEVLLPLPPAMQPQSDLMSFDHEIDVEVARKFSLPVELSAGSGHLGIVFKRHHISQAFIVRVAGLPGCVSQGATVLDAIANIGVAIQAWARAQESKESQTACQS